MTSDKGGMNRY